MRRTNHPAAAMALLLLLTVTACGGSARDEDGLAGAEADHRPDASLREHGGPIVNDYGINPEVATADDNRSTFALDVDTGSYTFVRGYLTDGFLPDPAAVRTEEFVNYFPQDYHPPAGGIGIHADGTPVPFLDDPSKLVIRIGLQAAVVDDSDRPPANLTFVVDTSGSMAGYNMEMVQAGLGRLVDSLRPDDKVAVVTFSNEAELRLPMTPMSGQKAIRDTIDALAPQQSTNLEAGLRLGYEQAQANLRPDGLNRVILLSDGVANAGQTDPAVLADQIAQAAGRSTQLVAVGVGRQTYNDVILEQFANSGNGFYAYVDTIREAERLFVHDLTGTLQAVGLDAKVQVSFDPQTVSHFRLLGYENRQLDHDELRDDTVDGGEVGAGHNVTALYEVTVPEGSDPAGDTPLATVEVRWIDPDSDEPVERSATLTAGDVVGSFDQAPPRLRQDVLVAALAECLRHAPWSEQVSLAQIADNAGVLSRALPGDEPIAELAELARTAAELAS